MGKDGYFDWAEGVDCPGGGFSREHYPFLNQKEPSPDDAFGRHPSKTSEVSKTMEVWEFRAFL